MPIRVARGTLSRIREHASGFVLQVRVDDPALGDQAKHALELAAQDIWDLDGGPESAPGLNPDDRNGPAYVSEPMATPDGPLLYVDAGFTPYRLLRGIPDIVQRRLEESGVSEATIIVPREGGPLNTLGKLRTEPEDPPNFEATLRLFPEPSGIRFQAPDTPEVWYEAATDWLRSSGSEDLLWAHVSGIEFRLPLSEAASYIRQSDASSRIYMVATPTFDTVAHAVGGWRGVEAQMTLAAIGPKLDDAERIRKAESLIEMARNLASTVVYAAVDVHRLGGAWDRLSSTTWSEEGGAGPSLVIRMPHTLVPDAFPYQILSAGHLERLGGPPPGARELSEGRWELQIGDLENWLAPSPPPGVYRYGSHRREDWLQDWLRTIPTRVQRTQEGRRLLRPCLVDSDEEIRQLLDDYRDSLPQR